MDFAALLPGHEDTPAVVGILVLREFLHPVIGHKVVHVHPLRHATAVGRTGVLHVVFEIAYMVAQQIHRFLRDILGITYVVRVIETRAEERGINFLFAFLLEEERGIVFGNIHALLRDLDRFHEEVEAHVLAVQVDFHETATRRVADMQPFGKARHHVVAQVRLVAKIRHEHPVTAGRHAEQC